MDPKKAAHALYPLVLSMAPDAFGIEHTSQAHLTQMLDKIVAGEEEATGKW